MADEEQNLSGPGAVEAPVLTPESAIGRHTPGPWKWDCGIIPPDGPGHYADIYKDGGDLIIAQFNKQIPEGHANARLIAAAPDLVAALKRNRAALDLIDPDRPLQYATTMDLMRKDMDAAIAQATGEGRANG